MFNTSTLPASIALPHSVEMPGLKGYYYTAKEGIDETPIYQELNQRLMQLETSTELHVEELSAIEDASAELVIAVEAKEEILLRIDWLKRLYEVKQSLPSISTVADMESLRTLLSSVQTCPLKSELLTELDRLAASLPAEKELSTQTEFDRVMELAIEQAGDAFINLGKAGRENIVQQVIAEFGENVSVDSIQEATKILEEQVDRLAKAGNVEALQAQLNHLPLSHYPNLSDEKKRMVAEQLLKKANWNGLASLDRMIRQLVAALIAAEEKDGLQSMESGAATSLDFNRLDGLAIQIR